MMGWQYSISCMDHKQVICTLLQTENHVSTSSFNFYRPDTLPATQPTTSQAHSTQGETLINEL